MLKTIIRYFHFTRAERRGTALLLAVAMLLAVAPAVFRRVYPDRHTDFTALKNEVALLPQRVAAVEPVAEPFEFDPNTASFDDFRRLGLSEKLSRTILRYRERGGRYRRAEDFGKMYGLTPEDFERLRPYLRLPGHTVESGRHHHGASAGPLAVKSAERFPFNPNLAPEAQLLQLGIPRGVAARMVKYREKGGIFRKPADVQKMYGFPAELFAELEPYIELPAVAQGPAAVPARASFATIKAAPTAIDVNRATNEDWQKLPGIGAGRAAAIVRYRERLGGFTRIEQLAEVRALPDSIFRAMVPYLVCEEPVVQLIAVNSATEEQLRAHPYFTYRQASALIVYRSQHGNFASVADLTAVVQLRDPAWLKKIGPYLRFE